MKRAMIYTTETTPALRKILEDAAMTNGLVESTVAKETAEIGRRPDHVEISVHESSPWFETNELALRVTMSWDEPA